MINPKFSLRYFKFKKNNMPKNSILFNFGRDALSTIAQFHEYKNLKIIAMPGFICDVVPHAFISNGWTIEYFYPKNILSVNLLDIEHLTRKKISLLLIPSYFGKNDDLSEIIDWATDNHISIISDLAHSIFQSGRINNKKNPDYTIYSLRKYAPHCLSIMILRNDEEYSLIKKTIEKKINFKFIIKKIITKHMDYQRILTQREKNINEFIAQSTNFNIELLGKDIQSYTMAIPILLEENIEGKDEIILKKYGYFWPKYVANNLKPTQLFGKEVYMFPIHQSIKNSDIAMILKVIRSKM